MGSDEKSTGDEKLIWKIERVIALQLNRFFRRFRALVAVVIFAGCMDQNHIDVRQVRSYADPITKNILMAMNGGNYTSQGRPSSRRSSAKSKCLDCGWTRRSYVTGEVIETTCNNPSYLYLYTRAQYVGYSLDCTSETGKGEEKNDTGRIWQHRQSALYG